MCGVCLLLARVQASQHAWCEERTLYAFIKAKMGSQPRGTALYDRMIMVRQCEAQGPECQPGGAPQM